MMKMNRLGLKIGIFLAILLLSLASLACMSSQAAQRGIVRVKKTGQSIRLYRDYQALVVGVGRYRHWPGLPNAVRDAREVAAALKGLGFSVELLENPTAKALKRALNRLPYGLGREKDRALLFYFAGHGATETMADGGKLGYLVPADCPLPNRDPAGFAERGISMAALENLALRIKSRHVLMAFDSCFSGSIFSLSRAAPLDISDKIARPVRLFITAGGENETVPDASVFKRVFIDGLKGEADLDGDHYVTGSELGMYLQKQVVNYTRGAQHPQYGKIRNPALDKGDFVLAVPGSGKPAAASGDSGSQGLSAPPAAPSVDLREYYGKAELRQKWNTWQAAMERAFSQAAGLEKLEGLGCRDKAGAWQKVAAKFPENNPFSKRDEALRQQAQQRVRHWLAMCARPAEPPRPARPSAVLRKQRRTSPAGVAPRPKAHGLGKSFTNSVGMKFVLIPAGSFMMGSPASEPERGKDEGPRHRVRISKPFYMQTTEVTEGQWRAVMGGNRPTLKHCGSRCPADVVSWIDAREFIRRLNSKEGVSQYRLPTEAEWEYACRAGSDTPFNTGANITASQANFCGHYPMPGFAKGEYRGVPIAVGSFAPNAWGLFDMHGNLFEWCQDRYRKNYAAKSPVDDPQGSSTGDIRVLRGGFYGGPAAHARSANRHKGRAGSRMSGVGFRLARTK